MKTINNISLILLPFILLIFACKNDKEMSLNEKVETYKERYRGQFHFSPPQNWMNDPNGMVYYDGEYHLFYQYNPYGTTWGHMSWGHAVSKDLVHWENLPVALYEEEQTSGEDTAMIFSGSAVMDIGNKSGLCPEGTKDCMVAIYTDHVHDSLQPIVQQQSLAYSSDKGRTWTKYAENPVISLGMQDFRDPKVFWHEETAQWIMSVNLPTYYKTQFYASPNLKSWELLSSFGNRGDKSRIWECPDLVELPILGEEGTRWVLIISSGHPKGVEYVGMQYFVGDFNGVDFSRTEVSNQPLWLEYGKDFYAAVTWNDTKAENGEKILLGWLNNWGYANDIPTSTWRGAMSIPRKIALKRYPEGLRLVQQPIDAIQQLRDQHYSFKDISIAKNDKTLQGISGQQLEIDLTLEIGATQRTGIEVLKSGNESLVIGYDAVAAEVYLDRTESGNVDFNTNFSGRDTAPVKLQNGELRLHIFVDHSIVEVYVNDGKQVLTNRVFPTKDKNGLQLFAEKGTVKVKNMDIWTMKSIW